MTNKVNRNQKVMGSAEKEIVKKNHVKRKENEIVDKETVRQAEIRIFEQGKATLPEILKQRLETITTALATELKDFSGLKETRIHQLISRDSYLSINEGVVKYTPTELMIVFEVYKEIVVKVNEIVLFVPSRASFCSFAGFSTITFKNNLQSPNDDTRNAYQIIEDYIIEMNMSSSKMRKTDAATSIFEMETVHQMVKATTPQIINVNHSDNYESIKNRILELQNREIVDADFKEKENK